MIYRCANCGGALEYSVEKNKMICEHCESEFEVDEVNDSEFKRKAEQAINSVNETKDDTVKMEPQFAGESMKMNIVKCTSCGAELAANENEVATFCAYCGQPTVVWDRVEEVLKPEYLIPFEIQQCDAERIIRDTLNRGFFVPKEIKNFQVEKLRGIYVPFWLMNFDYEDNQYWKYSKKSGKTTVTRYVNIWGKCQFHDVTVDASSKLNDSSSQRLEPYDMRQRIPFNAMYLSGFYADKFDQTAEQLKSVGFSRVKVLFDDKMKEAAKHGNAKLYLSSPQCQMTEKHYALLPAWFLSFKYDNMPYTIMVNGQTGKMVGAVPFVKSKVTAVFASLAVLFSAICVPVLTLLFKGTLSVAVNSSSDDSSKPFLYLLVFAGILIFVEWSYAIKKYVSIRRSITLTNSSDNNRYMKERQDK